MEDVFSETLRILLVRLCNTRLRDCFCRIVITFALWLIAFTVIVATAVVVVVVVVFNAATAASVVVVVVICIAAGAHVDAVVVGITVAAIDNFNWHSLFALL